MQLLINTAADNFTKKGYKVMPTTHTFDGVDVKEIRSIELRTKCPVGCTDYLAVHKSVQQAFVAAGFAPSLKGSIWGYSADGEHYYAIMFDFNIDANNGVTGNKNEAAINRRAKVIAKLKQLGY